MLTIKTEGIKKKEDMLKKQEHGETFITRYLLKECLKNLLQSLMMSVTKEYKVNWCELKDGLLKVSLEKKIVPEHKKARTIVLNIVILFRRRCDI